MTAIGRILPDWPVLMSRETAEAYVDGPAVLRLLEERGLRPTIAAAKMLRFHRRDIDAEVARMQLERGGDVRGESVRVVAPPSEGEAGEQEGGSK